MESRRESASAKKVRTGAVAAFALIALTTALGNMSQTAVNAMLPAMAVDLDTSVALAQWMTTGYMLVLGVTVPVAAFATYKLGLRGVLMLSAAFCCAGAVLDIVASSFALALAGRILQAIAAGLAMPLVQTAAMVLFEPGQRGTAMGVSGVALGFAPNIGPTIGGAMVDTWGWQSYFVLLFALAFALGLCAFLLVRKDMRLLGGEASARLDAPSFVLSGMGFAGLLLGFSNASSFGLLSAFFWVPLLVGVVFVVLFFKRQDVADYPLVSLRVFESPRYTIGLVCTMLLFASFMGVALVIPLFVEELCGGTAFEAGLALLPGTVAALLLNPLSGILTDKIGARKVVLTGGVFLALGALAAVFFTEETSLAVIMIWQGVRAIGVSLMLASLFTWSLSELDPGILSGGSAFSIMARQATSSFGTALMVFGTQLGPLLGIVDIMGYHIAFGISAACAVILLPVAILKVK